MPQKKRDSKPGTETAPRATTGEIVVFDIDGTLSDVSARLHHIRTKPKNWKGFFAAMPDDKAVHAIVRLCNLVYDAGVRVVLCSGRPDEYRAQTLDWLAREGVRYDELRLRRSGDRRSDTIAKREMLEGLDRANILFVVEDRANVVEMWRQLGLVCLQCAPGEF
jgi:phosphoglycolate phosphatase-like HAD superfamily hydrolase